jgi:hypothetical protein
MTNIKNNLVDYEEFQMVQDINLENSRTVTAVGQGNVHLRMKFETGMPKCRVLHNVLYVPKLTCNLFSIRAATSNNVTVNFQENECWIQEKNGNLLGMGYLDNKLYYLNCDVVRQKTSISSESKYDANIDEHDANIAEGDAHKGIVT